MDEDFDSIFINSNNLEKSLDNEVFSYMDNSIDNVSLSDDRISDIVKDIDNVFLNDENIISYDDKLEHIDEFVSKLPALFPKIDLILQDVEALRKKFSIYSIRLNIISKNMLNTQKRIKFLKYKKKIETIIYKNLRDLCIFLSMGEEEVYLMENGSFSDVHDLSKIERSLDILSRIYLNDYNIRIVEEKKIDLEQKERNFLKRFINFIENMFIKTESVGELVVHRKLYEIMKKYKFIFTFSKKYKDLYSVLCSLYSKKTLEMYELEFKYHIKSLLKMINDPYKLNISLKILAKTYESLIKCEYDFIKTMEIDIVVFDIFRSISDKIVGFIKDIFFKFRLATLITVADIINDKDDKNEIYTYFLNMLNERYKIMFELFIKDEKYKKLTYHRIERLNLVLKSNSIDSFKNAYLQLITDKLTIDTNEDKAEDALQKLILLHAIDANHEELIDKIDYAKEKTTKIIITDVFSSENELERIISLIKKINEFTKEKNLIMDFFKNIIIEHASTNNKENYKKLFR